MIPASIIQAGRQAGILAGRQGGRHTGRGSLILQNRARKGNGASFPFTIEGKGLLHNVSFCVYTIKGLCIS